MRSLHSSLLIHHHSGGLELLFDNVAKHKVSLPLKVEGSASPNVGYLVKYIVDNMLKDPRQELFVLDGSMCVSLPWLCGIQVRAC